DPLLRDKNITASFGIAAFPLHGSTPQELIHVADASMYLSKHHGGNTVSTADHCEPERTGRWKQDVLEAYLGVTLKRLFATGPGAVEEICNRLNEFAKSLAESEQHADAQSPLPDGPPPVPSVLIETLTSLALAIDSRDHYT